MKNKRQDIKKKITEFINMNCYAFTILVLINSIAVTMGISNNSMSLSLRLFGLTTGITALIMLIELLPIKSEITKAVIQIITIMLAIFVFGYLLDLVIFETKYIIINCIVGVGIYSCVSGILLLGSKKDAEYLNDKIRRMRANKS